MLYGILLTLFIIISIFLVLIVLIQQGKGSMGMGGLGGGAQMLFGGSGGQDIFQKITWVLGALFMLGSFGLTLMKTKQGDSSRYLGKVEARQHQLPASPISLPTSTADMEMPEEEAQ